MVEKNPAEITAVETLEKTLAEDTEVDMVEKNPAEIKEVEVLEKTPAEEALMRMSI
jgi:hypothetical protein